MKKKNIFKRNFIIISAVFILGLIFAFGSRLIHFYLKENKKINEEGEVITTNYFSDIIENTINVSDVNGGLYLDGDDFVYKYAANENYLWYSGQMWRIMKLNADKSLTIITDEAISLMQPKYEENNYINNFLDDFYNKLDQEYLQEFEYCNDQIIDIKKITCKNKQKGFVSLLDMYNYNKAGNIKSYLNNKTTFWLNNTDENNNYWYIDDSGAVGIGTENVAHYVRPIVNIKSNINVVSGDGTKENPYIIKNLEKEKISKILTGEYIKYNNSLWRVLNIGESVKAIKVECLKNEEECLNHKFGYNITYLNSSIYRYLNETYFNSLDNKEFLVKDKFYVGSYTDYSLDSLKEKEVEAYIGLPKIGEYYNFSNLNSYLITPNTIETVYTINDMGNYYLVKPTTEKNIYPILNFDINLLIVNGNGTMEKPFELGR